MGRLENRVAIVTGATIGLGAGIAARFAAEGAVVVAADIRAGEALCFEGGGEIVPMRLDVSSESAWRELMSSVVGTHGRLDVLVNNAGINLTGNVVDCTLESWKRTLTVNADGVFLGCKYVIEPMRATGGGSIINIASAAAIRPGSGQIAYTASKAAVMSITQSVALWCGENGTNIRCNSICPGCIDTPMMESYFAKFGGREATVEFFAKLHPIGRIGCPKDIANMAMFLATDDSSFVTGSAMVVDGGYTLAAVDGGSRPR